MQFAVTESSPLNFDPTCRPAIEEPGALEGAVRDLAYALEPVAWPIVAIVGLAAVVWLLATRRARFVQRLEWVAMRIGPAAILGGVVSGAIWLMVARGLEVSFSVLFALSVAAAIPSIGWIEGLIVSGAARRRGRS